MATSRAEITRIQREWALRRIAPRGAAAAAKTELAAKVKVGMASETDFVLAGWRPRAHPSRLD
jgi:hypothetical protein